MQFKFRMVIILFLMTLTGCNDGTIESVRVVNGTKATIQQVQVDFKDGAWMDTFGIIGAGKGAEITPVKPLARPHTASIRWVEQRVEHSADAEVRKQVHWARNTDSQRRA